MSSWVITGVVSPEDMALAEIRADVRRLLVPTRAAEFGLYNEFPESVNVLCVVDVFVRFPIITELLDVPTRAVPGFAFVVPRAVTLARDVDVGVLLTTVFVLAVLDAVPRAVVADALRGEDAIAREETLVREFVCDAADIARDADVERFIVLRCATFCF